MRVAPVGLVANRESALRNLGTKWPKLTHGHQSGYLSAGFMAPLIEEIVSGAALWDAVATAR